MIHLKNKFEIEKMYRAGQIVKETLFLIEEYVKPGITTLELDKIAENFIIKSKAIPGFKGLYGFPGTLCVSIDDEVVHGIPSNRVLKEGEIIGIDVGSIYDDFYGDHAKTFPVGKISDNKKKLLKITKESLMLGIEEVKVNAKIGNIGFTIQNYVEKNGFSVVRELVGHGIGRKLHEEPQVPNFGEFNQGPLIENGLCLAIEPMINMGSFEVHTKEDNWTVCTADGLPSAHFEHSIAIIDNKVRILTS
jgi:methionyl aminopeptidase